MQLVLFVCLLVSPQSCHEESLSVGLDPIGQMRCLMNAPPIIAQWSSVHPKWRVARWHCAAAGRAGEDI